MINLQQNIILVSNHYSQICNLYSCYMAPKKEHALSYNIGKNIIDKIFENALNQQFIPKFYFIGGDVIAYWKDITQPLIEYIQSFNEYSEIYIQLENENSAFERILKYCQDNNIYINIIYNNFTKNYIEKAIEYKPFLKLYYPIKNNNIDNIFENYQYFNLLKIKKIHFLIDCKIHNELLFPELIKIQNYIISSFQQELIPLIPDNLSDNFIRVIMMDKESDIDLQLLQWSELAANYCAMIPGHRVIFNQNGELFFCNHEKLDSNNSMYLGNIQNCNLENIKPFKIIYNIDENYDNIKDYHIYPQTEDNRCKKCNVYTTCHLNCFANNIWTNGNAWICNLNYCELEQYLYTIAEYICNILSEEKNEIFRDYLYALCSKGLGKTL